MEAKFTVSRHNGFNRRSCSSVTASSLTPSSFLLLSLFNPFLSEGEEEEGGGGSGGGGIHYSHNWDFPTGNTGVWSPGMLSAAKRRYCT